MCVDEERFEWAKNKIIGVSRERQGIGTLSEKTVHAVLKNYYAPDEGMHEVRVGSFVADIYTGSEIFEIQTRSFNNMRKKLDAFLKLCPVTVVYPIPRVKWVSWIDQETGEATPRRKSPRKGSAYDAFAEFYKIRPFLADGNLRFRLALMDVQEYRLLNGWSRDRKKGGGRYDRIPVTYAQEIRIEGKGDYAQFIPEGIGEPFTAKEFAGCAKISAGLARTVLLILTDLAVVERVGKRGNSYLYVRR